MAGSSEDRRRQQQQRRRSLSDLRDAEPEEGELVPGDDDSDVNTEDYYNNHNYYSSTDSDETTSDCNYAGSVVPGSNGGVADASSAAAAAAAAKNNDGSASSSPVIAAPAPTVLACTVCGKEFRSRKAVCGHMKVHQQGTIGRRHEQQRIGEDTGIKRNAAAVTGGWGGTGKRGSSGCWSKPASPNAAQSDQSMAIVVANPKIVLQPRPLAFAMPVPMEPATPNPSSVPMASGTPNPSSVPIASTMTNVSDEGSSGKPMHSDARETMVAGAASPPTEAVVHLHATARAPPSPPPAGVHATSVHEQPIEPPMPPPEAEEERVQLPPVHHPDPIAPPLGVAGRQNPDGYTCKKCGKWFATYQGLGGHMAGHNTRELAAIPCRRDAKPEKVHKCKKCDAVFPAGVKLGGHMRKHWTGPRIVPKKKPRLAVQPLLPPPAEQGNLEPAPRPAVPGRVRLFGVDIEAVPQMPAAQEEGSSATQAPSASTGGEE